VKEIVVDAHQHFWDLERLEYSWMTPDLAVLRRNYLPEDLTPLLSAAGVDRTIVVQAHRSLAEAYWLLELAAANDFVCGVVAWAELASPMLAKDLDELQQHAKFKGVRHLLHDEPDDAWMLRPEVVAGLKELERRGIPYDLLVRPQHLKYIPELRERCQRLDLVIDHIAKPLIASRKMDGWAQDIERVAKLPKIWCKLSGMITEAKWNNWTPEDLKPYVTHVVDCFGYDRVMFGSDWPVCKLAGSYERVVDALRTVLGPLSSEINAKVWGRNALEFYQLA
jgi:L-fucono-1,5-lactonase